MSNSEPQSRVIIPPFVKIALIGFVTIVVVQIFMHVPFLNEAFRRHHTAFAVGIPALLVGIWGVFVWRRRNSTPEYFRQVLHWLAWAAAVVWLAFQSLT